MCMCDCMYVSALHACLVSGDQKRALELLITYRWLCAAMWVLGTKPSSSARTASSNKHSPTSLGLVFVYVLEW